MVLVGLTGGIGAGKSTVSAALAQRGAVVVDADAITRELQQPGAPVFVAMVERFGPDIVAADGTLDRAGVAGLVFTDDQALADLNAIVHPAVGAEIARRMLEASNTDQIVILDVPLLVETGRDDMLGMIVVDCPVDTAVARLVEHRGFDEADARARVARQATREARLAKADLVIDNAGGIDALEPQIEACWQWLEGLRDPAT
jgi:dephospho-CoA kinase